MSAPKVLFACNQNSVRSPMAAALLRLGAKPPLGADDVDSAGVYQGVLDPFVETVMGEIGVNMGAHAPKTLKDVDLRGFDRIIALTPEARQALQDSAPDVAIDFWPIENPSDERGGRDAVLEAYRRVRDQLAENLLQQFPDFYEKP